MKLIIAEKPAVGRAIAAAIAEKIIEEKKRYIKVLYKNNEYIITWLQGHLLRLKEPEEVDKKYETWKLEDLPIYFPKWEKAIKFKVEDNKIIKEPDEWAKMQLDLIKKCIYSSEITEIIHAGDVDDEGQYLVDEVLEYFKNKKKVSRVLINDNTPETIMKAFQNIEDNSKFINMGMAAYARAIADITYGINGSRFFTCYYNSKGYKKTLTVGRVQTPTLALVVNRDIEIENHKMSKYYELFFKANIENNSIKLKFFPKKDNPNLTDKYIENKEYLKDLSEKLDGTNKEIKITKKDITVTAPLPFTTTELQITAARKFGYTAEEVLKITQKLKDPPLNAITYNRSDCPYLNDEHFEKAPEVIKNILNILNIEVPELDFSKENKSAAFDSSKVEVHHGIIPTGLGNFKDMSEKEKNIYKLIADYYIVQFLHKAEKIATQAKIELEEGELKARSEKITKKGFMEYLEVPSEEKENEVENTESLSSIPEGTYNIELEKPEIFEKETKPKPRYTEASLLKDMTSISKYVQNKELQKALREKDKNKEKENGSIGTPATQGKIIADLFRRGYLERKEKQIYSTELAREYLKILPEEIKSAEMTAKWWLIQEQIKIGKASPDELINSVLNNVKEIISSEYKEISIEKEQKQEKEVIGKCLICGKNIYQGKTKTGKVNYYCEGYKEGCSFSLWEETKYFDNVLKITKTKAKNLIAGKEVPFKLKSKSGDYERNLKLKITEYNGKKYVNFEGASYPKKRKDK